jgi:hypothetical protein
MSSQKADEEAAASGEKPAGYHAVDSRGKAAEAAELAAQMSAASVGGNQT